MQWDPTQYGRYSDERGRPFHDLLARVGAEAPRSIVDVGCGPGNLTATLAQRWPGAEVEGVDASAEMISAAAGQAGNRVTFRIGDAADPAIVDGAELIVSNAVLQWVPDHLPVLRRWADALPAGGWLAVQVPGNFGSPSHVLMRELAESVQWRDRLGSVLRHADAVAAPADYAALLLAAGLAADVWETTYLHVLHGPDPVLDWVRGTGLRPVLAALPAEDAAQFEAQYAAALRSAYPPLRDGSTVFAFRRIFAVGHRP
jgi:trans-aconitate 2-methyltransferase